MSSITCLSPNQTPSHVILLDIRGYDPGTAASSAERPKLGYPTTADNVTALCDRPFAQHDGAEGPGSVDGVGTCQEPHLQPTIRLLRGSFVHMGENIHRTKLSERPSPGNDSAGGATYPRTTVVPYADPSQSLVHRRAPVCSA